MPDVRVEERGGARPPYAGDVITFYSCSKGERAFEDPNSGHGVFFRYLIDGIGGEADLDGDGLGTLGELQTYVSRNVRNFVRDQHSASQQPELVGNVDPKRVLVAFKPASLLLKQGKELFERGRFDEVITVCTRLLENNPGWAEAYHLRGPHRIMENHDATSAAIGDFTAAIRHAKPFAEAYYDRGLVYLRTGEWDPSIRDFSAAIQLNLAGPDVWFYRGLAYLRRDLTDEAVADFTKAIQLNPGFAAAFLNRGLARTRQKKLGGALADYDKALALDPKMGGAFLNRGVIRLNRGELDEAIADFDRAVERCRHGRRRRQPRARLFRSRQGLLPEEGLRTGHRGLGGGDQPVR